MDKTFQKFLRAGVDLSPLGFELRADAAPYFCTPKGARILGWAGVDGIHYCTVRGSGSRIFAVSPMNAAPECMHPIAESFEDFLRLLLACGDAAVLEQSWQWDEAQFSAFLNENPPTDEQKAALSELSRRMRLTPMPEPWRYLRALQASFSPAEKPSPRLAQREAFDCGLLLSPRSRRTLPHGTRARKDLRLGRPSLARARGLRVREGARDRFLHARKRGRAARVHAKMEAVARKRRLRGVLAGRSASSGRGKPARAVVHAHAYRERENAACFGTRLRELPSLLSRPRNAARAPHAALSSKRRVRLGRHVRVVPMERPQTRRRSFDRAFPAPNARAAARPRFTVRAPATRSVSRTRTRARSIRSPRCRWKRRRCRKPRSAAASPRTSRFCASRSTRSPPSRF